MALSKTTLDRLIKRLKKILPQEALLHEMETMQPFECDGLSAYRALPALVCLPETIWHVQEIMRICYELQVPVIPRGAGTGLSGGALPSNDGVLLVLSKLNHILEIDDQNFCARIEPGVRNLALSDATSRFGLYYAPDPSSQFACTLGGNVAENSGGVHCLKYGLTVHNVLGLKIVTVEGNLLTLGGKTLDSPGYDLLSLLCGSEGLLGVVVEITVRLLPSPEYTKVILAAFDDVAKAGLAVSHIIAGGIIPAGLEMMDQVVIKAVENFVHADFPKAAHAIVLCEMDGSTLEVTEQIVQVEKIMLDSGAIEVRTAKDEAERTLFWKSRKSAFTALGRISPDYYCMDGTIPRRHLPAVLTRIAALSKEFDLTVANVFHAGDGNLHPLILYDVNHESELEKVERLGKCILELCVSVGGTITGEHGVGIEKLDGMCMQFKSLELNQFLNIKAAFDPHKLLNPGKALPTLHRCAEFGAMHVHQGQLNFPELERF